MFSVAEKRTTLFRRPSTHFKPAFNRDFWGFRVPIDEEQVQHEVVGEEDIHYEQGGNVKYQTKSQKPPAGAPPEHGDRKEQFPDENQANREWKVRPHLRQ